MTISQEIQYEVNKVVTGNLVYQRNYDRWLFLFESFVGGETYRQAKHLTRYQLETDAEYQARLKTTALENHCQSIVSVYTSYLFKNPPIRDFGSMQNLPEIPMILKDADLEGRSFNNFMKEVATWSAVFGHSWVVVSKPNINAVNRAQEVQEQVRPYLSLLTPLVVTDWEWSRMLNGRYELTKFCYCEDVNGNVKTYKKWTPTEVWTYVWDDLKRKITNQYYEVNQLGYIPAVICYNERSTVRGLGISAINDVADHQKFIYNATSEVDQSIRLDSHPSLCVTHDTQVGTGAGAVIKLPENLDPGLKPYVIDFEGAQIGSIYEAINHSVDAIERMSNVGAVRATATRTASGVALETEFSLLNARLSSMADNLELTEEQIWRIIASYQDQTFDMSIEYPNTFNIRDSRREIEELKIAKETATSETTIAAIDEMVAAWLVDDASDDIEED